jgi:NAD(P)-dependent dehydrogenase (short-subunit alcohol dehydrogenase family)
VQDFQHKTAIITGAGSGLGRATALALAREGAAVLLVGTTGSRLDQVAQEIAAAGGRAATLACDVIEPDAFERMRDLALDRFGRIDIVMNNAATISVGYPEQIPLEEWRRAFEVNVIAMIRSNHVMLPLLLAQGSGHIVNVASVDGLYGFGFDRLPYAASKGAVVTLSEGLVHYLRPRGIGVTCFCPGPMATNVAGIMRSFGSPLTLHGAGEQLAMMPVEEAAATLVEAIRTDRFLVASHDAIYDIVRRRAADTDAFVAGQIAHPHILLTAEQFAALQAAG